MPYKHIDYMTEDEIRAIPAEVLPLAVFSSNADSLFSLGIRLRRKTTWTHFMWMHRPGFFAGQRWTYAEQSVDKHFGRGQRLKFWSNPAWDASQRAAMLTIINDFLRKPAYTTRYDWLSIVGQLLGLVWLQNPATRMCSEYGSLLRESGVDMRYDLKSPAPDQVDDWFNAHGEYIVYGRYAGE